MDRTGYIKLHRALLDSTLWQLTDAQFKTAIGLLLLVNWTPGKHWCRRCQQVIEVPAGSTALSQNAIAKACGVSRKVVQASLRNLEAMDFVSNKSGSGCHGLYVLNNWSKYQDRQEAVAQARGRQGAGTGTGPGTSEGQARVPARGPDIRREEDKKERKQEGKKAQPSLLASAYEPVRQAMRDLLAAYGNTRPVEASWAVPIEALCVAYGEEPMIKLLRWLAGSSERARFWGPKVSSPKYLQRSEDGVSRYQRLTAEMTADTKAARGEVRGRMAEQDYSAPDWCPAP